MSELNNGLESRRTLDAIIIGELKEVKGELNTLREHDLRDLKKEVKELYNDFNSFKLENATDMGWIKAKLNNNGRGGLGLIRFLKKVIFT